MEKELEGTRRNGKKEERQGTGHPSFENSPAKKERDTHHLKIRPYITTQAGALGLLIRIRSPLLPQQVQCAWSGQALLASDQPEYACPLTSTDRSRCPPALPLCSSPL